MHAVHLVLFVYFYITLVNPVTFYIHSMYFYVKKKKKGISN